MLEGLLHAHSTYSDGEFTLRELRETLISEGCTFACVTDHADHFDAAKLRDYAAECEALSDERFRFVAGLEFPCEERMHVLGYGVTELASTADPQAVFGHIREQGGVAVIAHPRDPSFGWIESFDVLPDGIECWNSKYDGRYAPRARTFYLLQRLQRRAPELRAFYGVDLHWQKQFRGLHVQLGADRLERDTILAALAGGSYTGAKADLRLPADGNLPHALLGRFERINGRSARMRTLAGRGKRVAERFGARIPAPLKAQLRRMF